MAFLEFNECFVEPMVKRLTINCEFLWNAQGGLCEQPIWSNIKWYNADQWTEQVVGYNLQHNNDNMWINTVNVFNSKKCFQYQTQSSTFVTSMQIVCNPLLFYG